MSNLPFITALIVARNEEEYIEKCLKSLFEQSYPKNSYEILIVDGESTDKTVEFAKKTEALFKDTFINEDDCGKVEIKYFSNPKRNLASGWNMGIREAQGDYVVRIDAHAYADKDFLINSMKTIKEVGDAVCVGGAMNTESLSPKGKIIKEVLSSPFGVGGSKFRYMKTAGYVDTVAYGLYKKEVFDKIGYFNEALDRTQDNDLHRRIRAAGGKFYLNPDIKTVYYSRDSVKKMMKQAFLNGKWTMINFKRNPGKMAIRHFIPFAFVSTITLAAFLGLFNNYFWSITVGVILLHLIAGLAFAMKKTNNKVYIIRMPIMFLLLHLSYGTGSSVGLLKK